MFYQDRFILLGQACLCFTLTGLFMFYLDRLVYVFLDKLVEISKKELTASILKKDQNHTKG